jgi:uncharacterized protein YndB with AHSA1/START domain
MKRTVTLERTYAASPEEVWEMWTTRDGIESWWGPDGFRVEVRRLDLRVGGVLEYVMIAVGAEQIEFMRNAGLPLAREHRLTFTEVTPPRRLAYDHVVDFVPGATPYELTHVVELQAVGGGVRLALTFDAMHDDYWTEMARSGWESELGKLSVALARNN